MWYTSVVGNDTIGRAGAEEARRSHNPQVAGSNPAPVPNFCGMRVIVDPKMPANSFGLITGRQGVVCLDGVIHGPFDLLPLRLL